MKKDRYLAFFRELKALDEENVVGVGRGTKWVRGADTGRPAMLALVKKKRPLHQCARALRIPPEWGALRTDVFEVGDIRLHSGRKGVVRPARPGVSIGHYRVSAGTFGAVVYDLASGEALILSNNHVLANLTDGRDGRSRIGDAVLQPGAFDGAANRIGSLVRFAPLQKERLEPVCPYARRFGDWLNKMVGWLRPRYSVELWRENETANLVDCALARPDDAALIAADILEIGTVAGMREPEIGRPVFKSGRSSGLTQSRIYGTDVAIQIQITNKETALFRDQILAGPMSAPGDSGSLVVDEAHFAVGLLFAGSEKATLCNRIDRVCEALKVRMI